VNVSPDGGTVTLSHDETEWSLKTGAEKLGVVDLVNCALAGPGGHVVTMEVRSNTTNHLLARWTETGGLE
jgi:hypothetical protein